MSIQNCQYNISRLQRELADFQKRLSEQTKNEVEKTKRIVEVKSSMTRFLSPSMVQSKQRDIIRLSDEISRIQAKKADISRDIARKTSELHRHEQELARELERERRSAEQAEKRRAQEQLAHHRAVTQELTLQRDLSRGVASQPFSNLTEHKSIKKYHLFISHASEDKDDFVRPLADALRRLGVEVWYDEFELKIGDSLRRSIDRGLANSRYGVVVLSSAFFAKNWPQYELDGLVAREVTGAKVVLPIWHKITRDEVLAYSPTLADKVALNSSLLSIEEIAKELSATALADE